MATQTGLTQNAAQRLHGALDTLLSDFTASYAEEVSAPHLAEIDALKKELSARNDIHAAENAKLQHENAGLRTALQTQTLRKQSDTAQP